MATISERIKEGLNLRNMTQSELVSLTKLNKSSISSYISGKYEPKQKAIYLISKALNVSESWLMGYDVSISRISEDKIPYGFEPLPATVKVPRLGVISCGNPINSEENFSGYDDVPVNIVCDFTLVCEGDSMTGARINDGDLVYIRQQPTVENGQIAAVLIDGAEKLLKRVYINDDSVILQAENPAYPPRVFSKEDMNRVSIIGRAVGFTSVLK